MKDAVVGCHVSIAGGLHNSFERARERGCDCFQIFIKNPRSWASKPLLGEDKEAFLSHLSGWRTGPVVAHMPYLPNLASPKSTVYSQSVSVLTAELKRCEDLKIPFLVTHPGSHLGTGREEGTKRITGALNRALASSSGGRTVLLLENTAGTKNSIGGAFEEIAAILDRVEERDRVGVCLDTCHAFAAGYDIASEGGIEEVLSLFDEEIGLSRLKVIHLNDTKGPCNSHLDRHEHIGLGAIGEKGFLRILGHPAVRRLPLICETPVDERRDEAGNLEVVRELFLRAQHPAGPP